MCSWARRCQKSRGRGREGGSSCAARRREIRRRPQGGGGGVEAIRRGAQSKLSSSGSSRGRDVRTTTHKAGRRGRSEERTPCPPPGMPWGGSVERVRSQFTMRPPRRATGAASAKSFRRRADESIPTHAILPGFGGARRMPRWRPASGSLVQVVLKTTKRAARTGMPATDLGDFLSECHGEAPPPAHRPPTPHKRTAHDDGVDDTSTASRVGIWRSSRVESWARPITVFGVGCAGALSELWRVHAARPRGSPTRACAGFTTRTSPEATERPPVDIDHPRRQGAHRGAWHARLVHRARQPETRAASSSSRAVVRRDYYGDDLPFWPRSRPAPAKRGPTRRALLARHQRPCVRPDASFNTGEHSCYLPTRSKRSTTGRSGASTAEDDVDRHALPPSRPNRTDRLAATLSTSAGARARLARTPDRHRPAWPRRIPSQRTSTVGDGAGVLALVPFCTKHDH